MKKYGIFTFSNTGKPLNLFMLRANSPMPEYHITIAHNLLFDTEDEAESHLMKMPVGAYLILPTYVVTSVKDFANPLQMSNQGN